MSIGRQVGLTSALNFEDFERSRLAVVRGSSELAAMARDETARVLDGKITRVHIRPCSRHADFHPFEIFENTRLASTSGASNDMISSAVSTRSRSVTRRLAWRSRMRSSALRIERALENNGWVLRRLIYCTKASRASGVNL